MVLIMDTNIEVVEQEKEEVLTEQASAEDLAEGKSLFELALDKIKGFGLFWSFRSIEYLVCREEVTLNQLRSCVYRSNKGEVVYDVYKSCVYIITAGMVNPKTTTKEEYTALVEKAKDIVDDWREEFGSISVLQILLINVMQVKHHFFLEKRDVKILDYMSSENLQKDIIMNTIAMDMQVKVAQSQAVSS
jgi:hypothetical protein